MGRATARWASGPTCARPSGPSRRQRHGSASRRRPPTDAATRRNAIRQAARNRAATLVLRRHRRAFLAAYEAEVAVLALAGDRPTVTGIDWPES